MANLNDLPLNPETIDDVDPESVPLLGGAGPLPPQPGMYVFRLPPGEAIFNSYEVEETSDQGQRLRAVFADESALFNETLSQPYHARISNRVRYVKVNDPDNPGQKKSIGISDMAMLLRVVDSIPDFKTNQGYGNALVKAGGRRFKGEHTLTARCDPKRDIYQRGSTIKGKKGCGKSYATEAYARSDGTPVWNIPKDQDGKFAIRFACTCGAELRCWGQLRSFRRVKETTEESKS